VQEISKNETRVRITWFDFHHECRGMKYENLSRLLNDVQSDSDEMKFFEGSFRKNNVPAVSVISQQKGVFRTNCMDCLDRTNVVQSFFARRVLHEILVKADLSQKNNNLMAFEKFGEELERKFRDTWTRNADVLSMLYTGTGALKTDFTKTGKRTKKGALNDGVNSLTRYVKNNFFDGYKQNCVDLAVGKLNAVQANYKRKMPQNLIMLGTLIIVYPFLVKMVLDTLNRELFNNPMGGVFYKFKSLLFYVIVFGLAVMMLVKAITSNYQKFIEKPINNH